MRSCDCETKICFDVPTRPRLHDAVLGLVVRRRSGSFASSLVSIKSAEPAVLLGSSGIGSVGVAGKPSSLEAASSQTCASSCRDTRTAFAFASRAHLQHSSAMARYSAVVFMKMRPLPAESFAGFLKFVRFRSDSTKDLLKVAPGNRRPGRSGL